MFQGSHSYASVAFCCDPVHQPLPLGGKETRSQGAAALPSPRSVGALCLLRAPEQPERLGKSQPPEVSQGGFDPGLAASLARRQGRTPCRGEKSGETRALGLGTWRKVQVPLCRRQAWAPDCSALGEVVLVLEKIDVSLRRVAVGVLW